MEECNHFINMCEQCGATLSHCPCEAKNKNLKWKICDKCKAAWDSANTTCDMVELACNTNEILDKKLKELQYEFLTSMSLETLPQYGDEKNIVAVKHLFETETANWELWLKRSAELYEVTHDGTMYHVCIIDFQNDQLKYRIAMMQERLDDLLGLDAI